MNLRYLLLGLLLTPLLAMAQQLPTFSTDDDETWYYVVFDTNNSVFEDQGASASVLNQPAVADRDAQLWKLSGNQESCILTSKSGNMLHYLSGSNRFEASATQSTPLKLVANNSGKWELQLYDVSEAPSADKATIVMNGGSGTGKYLDLWTHNFAAAALSFKLPSEMSFPQLAPETPTEVSISGLSTPPTQLLSLWYTTPATNWVKEALPIGNGDIGAMLFGGIAQDRIQFNHKTLWKGTSATGNLGSYLTFGDLYITNRNAKPALAYQRSLDLAEAVAKVGYTSSGVRYEREYLASYPDGVIAIRYHASKDNPISVAIQLINGQGGNGANYTAQGATFADKVANGMNFRAAISVTQKGGTVTATDKEIEVTGAQEMTIYLTCGTDFDPTRSNHLTGDAEALKTAIETCLTKATDKGYEAIRKDHVSDYQSLFNRVSFTLPQAKNQYTTTRLLTNTSSVEAKAMVDMLVFQYGRYLTIASSRGISVPSNLQGIWCKDGTPSGNAVWASDIHSNINVQMNYWPVEPTNLSELHMPFLEYIRNEATREGGTWQQNARDLGASHGWVVNTAGNIFGGSSSYKVGKYSVANAWYCQHIWQHFAYTRDTTYLETFAMPLLRSTCEFWFDRLVDAQNGDGSLECPHEYSPEQGNIQNATAHSQQLVYELFKYTAEAIDILGDKAGVDETFRNTLADKTKKLDRGLRIDSKGLLREWKYQENTPNLGEGENPFADDESNVWQCHRHPSHLMALYPGFEIDPNIDHDIYNAAVASLTDRGDNSTGWGRAFRLCLWARTRNATKTYTTLRGFAHRTTSLSYDWQGGLYDNMLDAHATSTFQIEGNFGATAGIAEMLLQSRPDSIVILPTLPTAWSEGQISGLKAIGNFEVSISWEGGQLQSLKLTSKAGMPVTLAYPGLNEATVTTEGGEEVEAARNVAGHLAFPTVKGTTYLIKPKLMSGITQATDTAQPHISVQNGRIVLTGNATHVAVYDLQGRLVPRHSALTPGLYIVKADNTSAQVLVP